MMATTGAPAETPLQAGDGGRVANRVMVALIGLGIVFAILAYYTTSPVLVGAYSISLMLCLILGGVHVGASMGLAGAYALWVLNGWPGLLAVFHNVPYNTVSGWSISVLPMFILMGFLLWRSHVTMKLYDGAGKWLNWMPGGLAVTTKITGAALGAASGSSVAIGYALGRIAFPEMVKAGYPTRLSVTSILMAGSGGQLIPPSIILVVYAGVAGTSVGQQLLAGLVPGLVLVACYLIFLVTYSWVRRKDFTGEKIESVTWGERFQALTYMWPVPLVILVVVGGMYAGLFTATEAGAAGAFIALILLLVYRKREAPGALRRATVETIASTGSVFLLLIGAAILARAMSLTGLTRFLTDSIIGMELSRFQFLLMLILFYLVLGMFLDPIAMILLTVPLLMEILPVMDIDLIWFGVFIVLMGELAIITPPVGVLLYIIYRIVQDPAANLGRKVSIRDVMISAAYFIPITIAVAIILIFWPDLATWLPSVSSAK